MIGRAVAARCCWYSTTAAPASEVKAIVRSPTNMAAAKIAATDFNIVTSK